MSQLVTQNHSIVENSSGLLRNIATQEGVEIEQEENEQEEGQAEENQDAKDQSSAKKKRIPKFPTKKPQKSGEK